MKNKTVDPIEQKFIEICNNKIQEKGFSDKKDYVDRLNFEINEIRKQKDFEYPLKLYEKRIKIEKNVFNVFIYYLLDICSDFDIKKQPSFTDPEFPDIDVDYLPIVRQYLKEKWVPESYKEERVCNICNYTTFGLKSSLIDVARVLGEDRYEILALTTKLGLKDDEGEPLTWDSAIKLYPALAKYLEDHPKVADVAKNLINAQIDWEKFGYKNPPHRKRNMGMHASGLVISGVPLSDYVPMVVPSGSKDKNLRASAWVEGLADTDLSSVGFIKFDFLSLEANGKIAECNKIIRLRHGLNSICSVAENGSTWSDTSYLNDPKAIEFANNGDLKGVFQFDSEGIRSLVKKGGVSSFDDLAAYTALYRPGPMDTGMHEEFIARKKGLKKWDVPNVGDKEFQNLLKSTYGVLVYQEQVMKYLNVIGNIPISQCQGVIKAISKKKIEKFAKYKDEFVKNSQKVLNISEEEAKRKWDEIESFAGYGFNMSHSVAYTYITSRQLWQKVHYPIEFYTQDLAHLKTGDERIRDYIEDARRHGIKVNKLDLNKSDVNFCIINKNGGKENLAEEGDEIYFGFSKIKGIGEEIAQKIVDNQPYNGFQDFLERFGTDAKVVHPLIMLRLFDEKDSLTLYKFYRCYKNNKIKQENRVARYHKSIDKYLAELKELSVEAEGFDEVSLSKIRPTVDKETWNEIKKLEKRYLKSIGNFETKSQIVKKMDLENFNPDEEVEPIEEKIMELINDIEKSEREFYGFEWKHPLQSCLDYKDFTWEKLALNITDENSVYPVEVIIRSIKESTTKNGKKFWKMICEDSMRVKKMVTIWQEDIELFKDELKELACVRMRIKADKIKDGSGYWYNLEGSVAWGSRKKTNNKNEYRVYLMKL